MRDLRLFFKPVNGLLESSSSASIRIASAGEYVGDVSAEKRRIEQHFQQLKQEEMRHLLDSLNLQERVRIDNMVDKHATEMLQLIDKKVSPTIQSVQLSSCSRI